MIPRPTRPMALALDVSDLDEAERLARLLTPEVGLLKVGLELFWAHGPEAVHRIGAQGPVFVDCKLHDIPNTVERASANVARLGVHMFNVHALGGDAMMRAALDGAKRGADDAGVAMPLVLGVTVLSSHRPHRSRGKRRRPGSTAWSSPVRTCAMSATHAATRSVSSCRASARPAPTDTIRFACSLRVTRSSAVRITWSSVEPLPPPPTRSARRAPSHASCTETRRSRP